MTGRPNPLTPFPAREGGTDITPAHVPTMLHYSDRLKRSKCDQMKRDRRYNLLAPLYDASMALFEQGLRPLRQELQARAGGRVLDIGVGTGATLPHYPPGCRVVGIDTSAGMLRRAARRARELGLHFTPAVMDAQHLAFPGGSFDTVVSSLVLCSVSDPQRALCEVRRVLRPGGKALFLEHVRPSGALGVLFDAANIVWSPLVCQLTRQTESLVRGAGFQVVQRRAPADFLRVMEAAPVPGRDGCGQGSGFGA